MGLLDKKKNLLIKMKCPTHPKMVANLKKKKGKKSPTMLIDMRVNAHAKSKM